MAVLIAARAVLVLLASLAAHVQPSSSSGLPDDLHSWNRIPGFANATRIWDRQMLDRAIVHTGSLARAQHLFDKLSSGKRIVALAVGSSFVHDFAGCWQPSIEALWQLGVTPNPMLYPQQVGGHDQCLADALVSNCRLVYALQEQCKGKDRVDITAGQQTCARLARLCMIT